MPEPSVLTRRYTSSFVLDRTKLSRIVTIIEDRFAQRKEDYGTVFEIKSAKDKTAKLNSLDDLMELDNPIRNPAVSLKIEAATQNGGDEASCTIRYDNDDYMNIGLRVASHDVKWSTQLFAELDEQLERTFLGGLIYKMKTRMVRRLFFPILLLVIAMLTSMMFALIIPWQATKPDFRTLVEHSKFLSPEDVKALSKRSVVLETIEDKVDFLLELERRKLAQMSKPIAENEPRSFDLTRLFSWKTLFVGLPVLIIVVCLIYVVAYCYPHAVFAWGDCEEQYSKVLARRRTLWTVVVASLFIGIISGLFTFSVSQLLRPS